MNRKDAHWTAGWPFTGKRLKAYDTLEKINAHRNFDPNQEFSNNLIHRFGVEGILKLLDHPKTTRGNCEDVMRAASLTNLDHALRVWDEPKVANGRTLVRVAQSTFEWDSGKTRKSVLRVLSRDKRITRDNISSMARLGSGSGRGALLGALDLLERIDRSSPHTLLGALDLLERPDRSKLTRDNIASLGHKAFQFGADRVIELLNNPKVTAENASYLEPVFADEVLAHPKTDKGNMKTVFEVARSYGVKPTLAIWSHEKTDGRNLSTAVGMAKDISIGFVRSILDYPMVDAQNAPAVLTDIRRGVDERVINSPNMVHYLDAWRELPKGAQLRELFDHAIDAKRLGVPIAMIPIYQKQLAERGHFPNPGLVHELHKAKIKEAGRRKK